MYKKFLTLLVLLLIATSVFSECETTPDKINRFEANYSIVDEKNADVSIVLVAEFSEKCIIERIKQSMDLNLDEFEIVSVSPEQITCPTEFLKDRVDRELGDFEEGLTCTATFAQDKNHIRMSFVGTMKIPTQDSGVKTINLLGSSFTNSLPRNSSITITIPSTFTFIDHYPRNGQKTLTKVLWSPTPREQLKLSFSRIEKEGEVFTMLNNSNKILLEKGTGSYKLEEDIDRLTITYFNGTLDGNNQIINVDPSNNYIFSTLGPNAEIRNLIVKNPDEENGEDEFIANTCNPTININLIQQINNNKYVKNNNTTYFNEDHNACRYVN